MELIHKNLGETVATTQISDAQSLAISKAIISKLGIPMGSPVVQGGISFNSDGLVTVSFHIPREELEAIINEAGRPSLVLAEINRLPVESVIKTPQGYTMEKLADGWHRAGVDHAYTPNANWEPSTLLHRG